MMQRLEIMHDTDKGHGEDGGDYQNSDQVDTPIAYWYIHAKLSQPLDNFHTCFPRPEYLMQIKQG